jgi:hypothetical protein
MGLTVSIACLHARNVRGLTRAAGFVMCVLQHVPVIVVSLEGTVNTPKHSQTITAPACTEVHNACDADTALIQNRLTQHLRASSTDWQHIEQAQQPLDAFQLNTCKCRKGNMLCGAACRRGELETSKTLGRPGLLQDGWSQSTAHCRTQQLPAGKNCEGSNWQQSMAHYQDASSTTVCGHNTAQKAKEVSVTVECPRGSVLTRQHRRQMLLSGCTPVCV